MWLYVNKEILWARQAASVGPGNVVPLGAWSLKWKERERVEAAQVLHGCGSQAPGGLLEAVMALQASGDPDPLQLRAGAAVGAAG